MRRWLTSPPAVRPDGAVLSWVNDRKPGYVYPEISGLLLSLLVRTGTGDLRLRDRIAAAAIRQLQPDGGVGRAGRTYLFDSAMVLRGLLDHVRSGGDVPDAAALDRLHDHVVQAVAGRRAVVPGDATGRWSSGFGPHQLKVILALEAWRSWRPTEPTPRLDAELGFLGEDGSFVATDPDGWSYVHACCYAVEGLVFSGCLMADDAQVVAAVELLARAQRSDGSLPAWLRKAKTRGPSRADATAQAVRLWCRVDPERWAMAIDRGLGFLGRLQCDEGGIAYEPGSRDVNTWATIFAYQALRWARDGWGGEGVV